MGLSPEERRKIYEEEKARIEEEGKEPEARAQATTGLKPNVAGLLCYAGFWISGIIILILEQENRFVRFHAIQSIIVFGVLMAGSGLLGWIPYVGPFFRAVIGILIFILWIVLMVKAYAGEWYKIPVAGDIAAGIVPPDESTPKTAETRTEENAAPAIPFSVEATAERISESAKRLESRMDRFFSGTRAGRITSSSFTIAWNLVWLVFFSFFSDYIAYYEQSTAGGVTSWTRYPLLTGEYFTWLPYLITTLLLSITGHVILIIHDRYWLRETVLIILNLAGLATVISLAVIFPFDFSVLPSGTPANVVPIIVRMALIGISIGLAVGSLAMFIRLLVNIFRAEAD